MSGPASATHSVTVGVKPAVLKTVCWPVSETVELLCELEAVKSSLPRKSLSKPLTV